MKSLVLIDSDSLSRALLSQCLVGQGWRVIEAEDGDTGWELIMKHQPEAVVCDLRTPKRNGFKVCRLIREQAPLNSTNVVLTGVSRFANARETALATGADNYLVKPIAPADLLASLAHCRDGAEKAKPTHAGPTLIRLGCAARSRRLECKLPSAVRHFLRRACIGDQISFWTPSASGAGPVAHARISRQAVEYHDARHHTHWDHIQGFPFFIPAYNRKSMFVSWASRARCTDCAARFLSKCRALFPVGLNQMASHVTFDEVRGMEFDLDGIKVRTIFANHPGICLGYRLSTPSGDIVYMPDHEAYERHEIERQKLAGEVSQPSLDYARAQDEKVIDFIREADVVIGDTQYDAAEYPSRLGGDTLALTKPSAWRSAPG
jgi:CheY-like chemotaxis protein